MSATPTSTAAAAMNTSTSGLRNSSSSSLSAETGGAPVNWFGPYVARRAEASPEDSPEADDVRLSRASSTDELCQDAWGVSSTGACMSGLYACTVCASLEVR